MINFFVKFKYWIESDRVSNTPTLGFLELAKISLNLKLMIFSFCLGLGCQTMSQLLLRALHGVSDFLKNLKLKIILLQFVWLRLTLHWRILKDWVANGGPSRTSLVSFTGNSPTQQYSKYSTNIDVDERVQRQTGLWRRLKMLGQVLRTAVGRCHLLFNPRGPYNFQFLQEDLFIFRFF